MRITLKGEAYESYRLYAKLKHISVGSVVNYALKDWMESVGEGYIEDALARKAQGK
jgi:hypothetical protein